MTTEESNKLVAEFMGCIYNNDFYYDNDPNMYPEGIEGSKYHSSWDWLMPVVEKIEDTIVNGTYFSIHIIKAPTRKIT